MSLFQSIWHLFIQRCSIKAIIITLYLMFWAILILKKMDWVLFPYNDMFSGKIKSVSHSKYYSLKVNGKNVEISDYWYWKKDMLEQSIQKYAVYSQNNNMQYSDHFFLSRLDKNMIYQKLYTQLKTPEISFKEWTLWYLNQAGYKTDYQDKVELIEYRWINRKGDIVFTDSVIVNSVIL